MEKFEFHKIFFSFNPYGAIDLVFFNVEVGLAIEFDGYSFYLRKGFFPTEGLEEMSYTPLVDDGKSRIVGIWHTDDIDDINFVEMENGDIFQIYYMWNDEKEEQKVVIYDLQHKNTPVPRGTNLYDAVKGRFNEAVVVKMGSGNE